MSNEKRPICGLRSFCARACCAFCRPTARATKSLLEFSAAPLVAGRHVESMHATRSDHRKDFRTLLSRELDCLELHCVCSIWESLGDPDPKDQDRSDMRCSEKKIREISSHLCSLSNSKHLSKIIYLNGVQPFPTMHMTGRRFHRTMEMTPPSPGSLKALLLLPLQNFNNGTQGVRARYDAELPPLTPIVRHPGCPDMLGIEE